MKDKLKIIPVVLLEQYNLKVNKDDDAEFYVDSAYYDLSDSNIVKLKPGVHKIKFKKSGFKDIEANIKVKKGETATINVKTSS